MHRVTFARAATAFGLSGRAFHVVRIEICSTDLVVEGLRWFAGLIRLFFERIDRAYAKDVVEVENALAHFIGIGVGPHCGYAWVEVSGVGFGARVLQAEEVSHFVSHNILNVHALGVCTETLDHLPAKVVAVHANVCVDDFPTLNTKGDRRESDDIRAGNGAGPIFEEADHILVLCAGMRAVVGCAELIARTSVVGLKIGARDFVPALKALEDGVEEFVGEVFVRAPRGAGRKPAYGIGGFVLFARGCARILRGITGSGLFERGGGLGRDEGEERKPEAHGAEAAHSLASSTRDFSVSRGIRSLGSSIWGVVVRARGWTVFSPCGSRVTHSPST